MNKYTICEPETVADVFALKAIIDYARKKRGAYNFGSIRHCPVAQMMNALGFSKDLRVGGFDYGTDYLIVPSWVNKIVHGTAIDCVKDAEKREWRWSALRKRAEAKLAEVIKDAY
jgi:hypothetical protein